MPKEEKTAAELEAIILRETGISAIARKHPDLGWTATAIAAVRGFKEIKKRLDDALPDLRARYTLC